MITKSKAKKSKGAEVKEKTEAKQAETAEKETAEKKKTFLWVKNIDKDDITMKKTESGHTYYVVKIPVSKDVSENGYANITTNYIRHAKTRGGDTLENVYSVALGERDKVFNSLYVKTGEGTQKKISMTAEQLFEAVPKKHQGYVTDDKDIEKVSEKDAEAVDKALEDEAPDVEK